jgi:hypothetical protein
MRPGVLALMPPRHVECGRLFLSEPLRSWDINCARMFLTRNELVREVGTRVAANSLELEFCRPYTNSTTSRFFIASASERGRIASRKQLQTPAGRYAFMALSRIFEPSLLEILRLHSWSFASQIINIVAHQLSCYRQLSSLRQHNAARRACAT